MKDKLFENENPFSETGFVFDARVSTVFDDMVNRSVPGYSAIQLLVADMALKFSEGGVVYDLGCSTGNTLSAILERNEGRGTTGDGRGCLRLVGIDNSEDMLKKCQEKIQSQVNHGAHSIALECQDLLSLDALPHGPASVIILNLVLQFMDPRQRATFLKKLYQDLNPGGALILVEKTMQSENSFNDLFIDYYHSYKKEMGYSDMEIAGKREALENRLIPFTSEQNIDLLKETGFKKVTTFFQWMNFCGMIAVRDAVCG